MTTQNTIESKEGKYPSELRQDIITGHWVVIATGRAKRPDEFVSPCEVGVSGSDPFENPEESGQEPDVLIYRQENNDWSLRVFPNKFPAFVHGRTPKETGEGPYYAKTGVGHHEVIVTRDPVHSIAEMEVWRVAELVDAYQERYLALMNKKSVSYIQIFHNHGREAGASLAHPHSQLMAIPVVPSELVVDLEGSKRYFQAHRQNVFDVILEHELKTKKRVVFENEHFVVFCPYASRSAFEVWVMPKRDNAYFERITDEEKFSCGEALKIALASLFKGLENPAYNFFIHTAPCDGQEYKHFRWHIEIIPRTTVWAGFELSTGIEVSTIEPEVAAPFLRSQIA
jgi:UDPglucose--hexose-1-phosphate uridylyltransferase